MLCAQVPTPRLSESSGEEASFEDTMRRIWRKPVDDTPFYKVRFNDLKNE